MIWFLHIAAVIFFIPALFITVPAHIVINILKKKGG